MPKFEIKKYKSFVGREGYGYNLDLHMDGKLVAVVIDDASGGMVNFHFPSNEAEEALNAHVDALPAEPIDEDAPEWEREMYPNGRKQDLDMFVACLVDAHETAKQVKRHVAKKTCVKLPSHKKGEYMLVGCPFTPDSKRQILAKHPDAVFINELFPDGEWMAVLNRKAIKQAAGK